MGTGQLVVGLLIMCGIGGYYYWKFGGKGSGEAYLAKLLGLREGEKPAQMWTCRYDIDRTLGDKVGDVLLQRRTYGITVMLSLTDQGRLVTGEMEKNKDGENNPPRSFGPTDVAIGLSDKKPESAKLVGAGGLEKAVVMTVEPRNGETAFNVQIAESGYQAIQAWANRA
jgi:hypothetical protein